MDLEKIYYWEIELQDGKIITEGNEFDSNKVIRVSFIPKVILRPRYDIIFSGFKLIKRFSRGFVGWGGSSPVIHLKEYLHCIITDKFRFYLKSSDGQCIITDKDYEWYI